MGTRVLALLAVICGCLHAQHRLPTVRPEQEGFAPDLERRVGKIVDDALSRGQAPGAVVLVGRNGRIVLQLVRGLKSVDPRREAMTRDAVFDLASLTKCVATATSVMKLIEEGRLSLQDRVWRHLPEFAPHGKDAITIEQLLRHRGGLLPDNALQDYQLGPAEARARVFALGLRARPGTRYIYTDVGFIVLGWIVEKITGRPLDTYAREEIFEPLGMKDTHFARLPRGDGDTASYAPTEPAARGEAPLRGVVHDPRARLLNGVAGHAGLFSTADDLAIYCAALLSKGRVRGMPAVLGEATVRMMISDGGLAPEVCRGLGWDRRSGPRRRGPRGRHFPPDSFGHTGFTGTSLWMDPRTSTFVVLLTSRLHGRKSNVSRLRHALGTAVAASLQDRPWPLRDEARMPVTTGLERFAEGRWPRDLEGLRVGLITNHTGRTRDGRSAIDLFHESEKVRLAALFSPEHGIRGEKDERIEDGGVDPVTGLTIHSLYGKTRRPTEGALEGIDVLAFDIQDIGTRFYTYVSTMVNAMEEAAKRGMPFVVLDRPNPIGGVAVEGPVADAESLDFVGALRIPVRHGMTVGELGYLAREERRLDLDLRVLWVRGWRRGELQDETGIPWINPSPNMRNLTEALLYPGIGLIETTNVSVGRGTTSPFEIFGAPWIDGRALCRRLRERRIPGIDVRPVLFMPNASRHRNRGCYGIRFSITDRDALRSVALGVEVACLLKELHGDAWNSSRLERLLKHERTLESVLAGRSATDITRSWQQERQAFRDRRESLLLYDP